MPTRFSARFLRLPAGDFAGRLQRVAKQVFYDSLGPIE